MIGISFVKQKLKVLGIIALIWLPLSLFFNNCSEPGKATPDSGNQSSSSSTSGPAPNEITSDFSGTISAGISSIGNSGSVYGYALDPANKTKYLRVFFYIDGVVGKGKLAGDILANLQAPGPNLGHYFSFQIPSEFADGKTHLIYAYAYSAVADYIIKTSITSYTAYSPKAETVFNSYMKSYFSTNCSACHGWSDYKSSFFGPLLSPTPKSGGSATNNGFVNKLLNGHNGRTCNGSVNNLPCSAIQAWWNAEFL